MDVDILLYHNEVTRSDIPPNGNHLYYFLAYGVLSANSGISEHPIPIYGEQSFSRKN